MVHFTESLLKNVGGDGQSRGPKYEFIHLLNQQFITRSM